MARRAARRPPAGGGRGRRGDLGLGRRAVPLPASREAHDRGRRRASETLTALLVVFGVASLVVVPALALLYTLDQRTVLEEEAEP